MIAHKGMGKVRSWRAANRNPTTQNPCTLAVGALPRSGKSYMGAALVHQQNLLLQAEAGLSRGARALIYTTQPTETGSTWTDVLSKHAEFDASGQQVISAWQALGAGSSTSTAAAAAARGSPPQNLASSSLGGDVQASV
jgi:hypothetical protein